MPDAFGSVTTDIDLISKEQPMSSPSGDFSGIVSHSADQTTATYLPLESLTADIMIADMSARVSLSQVYSHSERDSLREAHYIFPVPASAAVCSFELRTSDGRRLKGVVKDLSKAKEDYDKALSEGRLASLLQQFRQDVFILFIGTIPPRTEVTVNISYVTGLPEDDEADTVRFQLPSHVGARYGAPPSSRLNYGTANRARLSITADVEMPSRISQVVSLTHPDAQHVVPRTSRSQPLPDDHYARVQFTSEDTFLDKDFLLVIQAPGLDKPRCFAESLSPGNNSLASSREGPTTALALTVVPRFDLPVLQSQEYIFLIDRSGSMAGQKIELAKKALVYLLRTLPATGTLFNIFGFGTTFKCLWNRSVPYNQVTLNFATHYIDSMQADLGGTELLGALTHLFRTRNSSFHVPTGVFVLTDGWVYNINSIIDCIRREISSAPDPDSLRIFTLGIGDGASTELCERIALEGNGDCSMMLDVEESSFMLRPARLVNAMRVATVKELAVDWGVEGQVFQAPSQIPHLSPGVRLLVTAIVPKDKTPTHVTLKGRLSDSRPFEYRVPVKFISPGASRFTQVTRNRPPLLHTIAAHRHIQELEGGRSLPRLSPATQKTLFKALIIEIGTRYQVASEYTAFVAIDAPHTSHSSQSASTHDEKKRELNVDARGGEAANGSQKSPSKRVQVNTMDSNASAASCKPLDTSRPPVSRSHIECSTPPKGSQGSNGGPRGPQARHDGSKVSHASQGASNCSYGAQGVNAFHNPEHAHEKSKTSRARRSRAGSDASQSPRSDSHSPPLRQGSDDFEGSSRSHESSHTKTHHASVSQPPAAGSNALNGSRDFSQQSNENGPTGGSRSPYTSNRQPDGIQLRSNTALSPVGPSEHFQPDQDRHQGAELPPEIYTHEPLAGSPQEVLYFPDPLGGAHQVIVCTAPPLPQVSLPPPRRSFWSWLSRPFRAAGTTKPNEPKTKRHPFGLGTLRVLSRPSKSSTNELMEFSRLQNVDGSFSFLSTLSTVVSIPEPLLHSKIPPSLASNPEREAIWSTAIAVAFLRVMLPLSSEIWEPLEAKSVEFGSSICTSPMFEDVIQQAMGLFKDEKL